MIDLARRIRDSKLQQFIGRYVDYSTAWKAALFLGIVVFCINYPHGVLAALPAALKQSIYTFFVAGLIVRLCENLILNNRLGVMAIPLSVLLPSSIAVGLTFLLHSLKGTPEPLYSTLPTMLMAPPSFAAWAWRCKRNFNNNSNQGFS
jgi:hypothetical protein